MTDILARLREASPALADVFEERQRQRTGERWTISHDDKHTDGELARAGASYALYGSYYAMGSSAWADKLRAGAISVWPWSKKWWKPTNARRDLVKAAALIIAEIERRDRMHPLLAQERTGE